MCTTIATPTVHTGKNRDPRRRSEGVLAKAEQQPLNNSCRPCTNHYLTHVTLPSCWYGEHFVRDLTCPPLRLFIFLRPRACLCKHTRKFRSFVSARLTVCFKMVSFQGAGHTPILYIYVPPTVTNYRQLVKGPVLKTVKMHACTVSTIVSPKYISYLYYSN